ncbi:hypothetical protein ACXR2U_15375 [Jatrophihabitans sp. YIM 134969]
MSSSFTTYATVVEDQYRRERATHDLRTSAGVRHHSRFLGWRDRRRNGTAAK